LIVMTLARVGTGGGPDLAKIGGIVRRAGDRRVYAAGGVRGLPDLLALRDIGAAGALVATALHRGQIKTGDLEEIAG
jgi:phosphoribosylformimino-5-aminoimidazole carboxamide ribotide isomerase